MYIKYLCKKDYLNPGIEVKYGEVVKVEFNWNCPKICGLYRNGKEIEVLYKLPDGDLNSYFYLYDDIGSIQCSSAIKLIGYKFKTSNSEKRMLKELQYYTNARFKFLQQCATEDIQSEQSSTETLHTTSR